MRVLGPGVNIPGKIRLIERLGVLRYLLSTAIALWFALASNAWAQGDLTFGALSTPTLYDISSYGITDPAARTPVANPPGGLIATAAWNQYGMRLNWSVTDNGDGTYTYHYDFGPGWYPPDNGTGGGGTGTGNPYVTNKFVNAWDIQLGSGMTMADISNATWNVYQFDGKKIGSGTAGNWANYVDPDTGNVLDTVTASGTGTLLKVVELTGKTGNAIAGYFTNSLFHGLQWFMPIDPVTNAAVWNTNVNFDLTFTSSYAPGWGNFFSNSTRTGANNNYSEVVAFDGTFDATGKAIAVWSNGVSTPGTPNNAPGTATISAPSASSTQNGPITFTVAYNYSQSSPLTITLSPGDITLNSTGTAAAGTIAVTGTGRTRTVTIDNITGDGTLGISLAAGTATDVSGNIFPAAGPGTTFIVDNTPPTILSTTPASGSNGVDIKSVLTVQFSEPVNLTDSSFTVNGVTGSMEYVDSTHTAYFIPSAGLSYYTTYTVTITGVKDLPGNAMAADKTWTFTTAPHYGDLKDSGGAPDFTDALKALRITTGLESFTSDKQRAACDVAPLVNGKPHPDGKIDGGDVIVILRRVVGLDTW